MMLASVLLILLQVCSFQLMLVAKPTCLLQGHIVQTAHRLLQDLGGDFPVQCLQYNANISFPDSAFPVATANHAQCKQANWVVYKSLEEAELVFVDYDLPEGEGGVTWDAKKLDNYKEVQNRLVEHNKCLSGVASSGQISGYFSNVTSVLQQQDGAFCGWMALRRDLLRVLLTAIKDHRTCFTWQNTTEDTRPRLLRKRSHAH